MSEAQVSLNQKNSDNLYGVIDKIVGNNNLDMGSAIIILQKIQGTFGYVSPEMLERVSQLTGIPTSMLYSIVTFYAQFRIEPIGENLIQVCHGTACHLAGAEKISEAIEIETGAKAGHTSPDGKFTIEKVACLGCCSLGPVMNINDETCARMTPESARQMIKQRREGCHCGGTHDGDAGSVEGVAVSD